MEQTDKIKMESDTFALRRDYKYALENAAAIKKDVAELLNTKDKVHTELLEKQEDLTKIQNQISQEKLDWTQYRHAELKELEVKQAQVEVILKRKAELDEQEEAIRKIESHNTDILNTNRTLELKLEKDKAVLLGKEMELNGKMLTINDREAALESTKQDLKIKVENLLKEFIEL